MLSWITAAQAGLAPPDVLVLYSVEDPDARSVAEAYAASRELRAEQLCGVGEGLDPTATTASWEDFEAALRGPFEDCLAAQPDPDDVDALVLVRGLPYRVTLPSFVVSLEHALQVGHATSFGEELAGQGQASFQGTAYASVENPVFLGAWDGALAQFDVGRSYRELYTASLTLVNEPDWPGSFERDSAGAASGYKFGGHFFLVSRLDGFDHDDALALVERGLEADGTFPSADLVCMYGADEARGARDDECEFVVRQLEHEGLSGLWLEEHDASLEGETVAAYFTGAAGLTEAIAGQTYVPGAITDNLTSYGAHPDNFSCSAEGACPASEQQTSIARYVEAGATAAHGTVAEPLNNVFPHASTILLYAHGYSLGESYLFSTPVTYWQNLLLGDPLTVPYGERPTLSFEEAAGEVTVRAEHPDGVSRITLYRDGLRVAEAEGATLVWLLDEAPGETVELQAVARSGPVEVDTRWPGEVVRAHPEIAGWASAELVVTEPADTADTADTGLPPGPEPEPCGGCGQPAAAWPLAWLTLALLRRRP